MTWTSRFTPAAIQQLRAEGFSIHFEQYGGPATGKTSAAAAVATRLRKQGFDVKIEEEIQTSQGSGVRVWARRL